jgi:hypothetical protein
VTNADVRFDPPVRIRLGHDEALQQLAQLAAALAPGQAAGAGGRFAAARSHGAGWAQVALDLLAAGRGGDADAVAAAVRAGADLPTAERIVLTYQLARLAGSDGCGPL